MRVLFPQFVFDPRHGDAEILGRRPPSARNKCPARHPAHSPRARNHRPVRRCLPASAAARALSSALAAKVAPVSSGSGRPSRSALTGSMPCGPSSALISRTLPRLWLATTSGCRAAVSRQKPASAVRPVRRCPCAPGAAAATSCSSREGRAFRGALDLHQAARAGQHEIGVGLGGGIFARNPDRAPARP